MANPAYTKLAKWYNLVWLSLITFSSIGYLVLNFLGEYRTRLPTIEVFRSLVIIIAGIIAILGIIKEELWVRWFAIAIYGFYIFLTTEGLVGSFSSESALRTLNLIDSSTLITLRVWRVIILLASLIGILLLLRRSRRENDSTIS